MCMCVCVCVCVCARARVCVCARVWIILELDLPDGGAKHFADTVRELKRRLVLYCLLFAHGAQSYYS